MKILENTRSITEEIPCLVNTVWNIFRQNIGNNILVNLGLYALSEVKMAAGILSEFSHEAMGELV